MNKRRKKQLFKKNTLDFMTYRKYKYIRRLIKKDKKYTAYNLASHSLSLEEVYAYTNEYELNLGNVIISIG